MDIVRYDQLTPSIITELPGCSSSLVLASLMRVGREFFRRTGAWTATLDPFDAVEDQAAYTLPLSGLHTTIDSIIEVRLNTEQGVTDGDKGVEVLSKYYSFTPPLTITFQDNAIPSDSVTSGFEVDVALFPNSGETEVPSFILNRYAEGIRAGVLSELMMQVNHPWSSPDGSRANKIIWNRTLNQAIADRERGFKQEGWGLSA